MTSRALLCFLALALASPTARAELSSGDDCRLSKPLLVKLRNSVQGSVETELPRGTEITISDAGLQVSRIQSGEVEALASTSSLEAVCAVPRARCVLTEPIKMATERSPRGGKSKVFKVKAGATLSILERGPSRSRVLVGNVRGRVNTEHLDEKCRQLAEGASAPVTAAATVGSVTPPAAGTRVAVLPFVVAKNASAVDARVFEDRITEALQKRRRDVVGPKDPRPAASERLADPKQHLATDGQVGAQLGVPYVVAAHLSGQGKARVLSLSVVDVRSGRVVRTVRARPTHREADPWADVSSGFLHEVLPGGAKHRGPKKP